MAPRTEDLSAYRSPSHPSETDLVTDGEGRQTRISVPQPQGDHAPGDDAAPARQQAAPPAPAQTGEDPPFVRPTQIVDNVREAIAARFDAKRAAARVNSVQRVPFVDHDAPLGAITDPNHPDYIADEEAGDEPMPSGDEPTSPPTQQYERQPAPAPKPGQAPAAQPYQLRVDGNSFQVDRSQLLHYAEVDENEASEMSDLALVRLAQKQIAATNRLEEARQTRSRAREAATDTTFQPEGDSRQPNADPNDRRTAQLRQPAPPAELIDAVRELQVGDPEEAAQKFYRVFGQAMQQSKTDDAANMVQREVRVATAAFGQANPDLMDDVIIGDVYRTQLTRAITEELRPLGLTDREVATLINNPALAAQAYMGARVKGFAIRAMSELMDDAGNRTRTSLRLAPAPGQNPGYQQPAPRPPQPGLSQPPSRRELKRSLAQPPALSGAPNTTQPQQRATPGGFAVENRDPRKASETIREIARSRFQV